MPVCAPCRAAICALYPKSITLPPQRETTLTYPPYDADDKQSCWICLEHAEFLLEHYPDVYSLWLQEELVVGFQAQSMYMEGQEGPNNHQDHPGEPLSPESRTGQNMEVHQQILTRKHESDKGEGCIIELRFFTNREIPEIKRYGHDTASNGIDLCQIQRWISNCTRSHPACRSYSDASWYPTRLLDLGATRNTLNLIISKETEPSGPYMTLSHRWGTFEYEKLTSTSLTSFKRSIDLQSLPRLFQQAIEITRSIGIRYLWIDSLCIMQDKACGDWKIEALKMGQVYANTYLNLSASHAVEAGDNPSIFYPKPWTCVLPSPLYLPDEETTRRNLFLDGYLWTHEVHEAPLMGRGWVFQERFLSPRILHFGMRQLAWECNEGSALEMFPSGLPPGFDDSFKRNACVPVVQSMQVTNTADFCIRWHEIVNTYSACDLTFQSDKLIAFAGVAKLIESRRDDDYIAGLWKSTLREDLAWWLSPDTDKDTNNSQAHHRAPSWSWLSIDGEICFSPPPSAHHQPEYLCRVLRVPSRLEAGSSALNARGMLELEGLVFPISSLEWLEGNVRFFQVNNVRFETADGPESTHFDYDGKQTDIDSLCSQKELYMLPLYATGRLLVGILVSKLFTHPSWQRVGAVCIQYANIPPEFHNSCLEGWVSHPESDWIFHVDGCSLYNRISEAFRGGRLGTIKLV